MLAVVVAAAAVVVAAVAVDAVVAVVVAAVGVAVAVAEVLGGLVPATSRVPASGILPAGKRDVIQINETGRLTPARFYLRPSFFSASKHS